MNKHATIGLGLLSIMLPALVVAQIGPPSPAPELKKLDYFTGNWRNEATIAPGPWGGGGKIYFRRHGRVAQRRIFSRQPWRFLDAGRTRWRRTELTVFGYDADKKTYTEDRFDSSGPSRDHDGNRQRGRVDVDGRE